MVLLKKGSGAFSTTAALATTFNEPLVGNQYGDEAASANLAQGGLKDNPDSDGEVVAT